MPRVFAARRPPRNAPAASSVRRLKRPTLWAIAGLALLVFSVYGNSFSNPFLFDDQSLIVDNVLIRHWRFLPQIFTRGFLEGADAFSDFYRPLQTVTYLLDYHFWRLNPVGYHLTNVTLHGLNAVLFYLILRHHTTEWGVPVMASALFAVHPVHTQAVTYLSGRADLLAVAFCLLGLLCHITSRQASRPTRYHLGVAACFGAALLSKELALLFPFVLGAYDLCSTTAPERQSWLRRYAAVILVGLAYLGLRASLLHLPTAPHVSSSLSTTDRMWTALGALWTYLRLLVAPVHLHMLYHVEPVSTIVHPRVLGSLFLLGASLWWIRRSITRSPVLAFYALWVLIGFLPILGIVPLNAVVAEHWWYFPSMGIMALVSLTLARWLRRLPHVTAVLLRGSVVVAVTTLGVLTIRQNRVWSDPLTFYPYMISHAPHRPLLYVSFGDVLRSRGQTAQALQRYQQALELNPIYDLALGGVAACYRDQGHDAEAQRWYERALHAPNGARRPALHNDVGVLYLKQGQVEQAIVAFQKAVTLHPYRVECWANLGRAYAQDHQTGRAIEAFTRALALDPNHVGSHQHLGNLDVLQHRYHEAIPHYQQANALQPDPRVYLNLGICYLRLGQPELAKQAWEQALKLKPDYEEARVNLTLLRDSTIQ